MKKTILLCLVLALVACHRGRGPHDTKAKDKKNGPPPVVEVADVERGGIRHVTTVTATLEAERQVQVVTETMGVVESILTEEGRSVIKGTVIATLRHRDEEIALKSAEVEYEHQTREQERNRKLYDQGLLSPEAMAQTDYLHDQALVALEDARMRLEKTSITAPFSGTVAKRHIHVGQHVQALTPLFTLTDDDPLLARIYLPEETATNITVGDAVEGAAREGSITFLSTVLRVLPVVDAQTGTVEIVLAVRGAVRNLRPGSFATFDVVDKVKKDAILIPIRSLLSELDQNWVYSVNDREIHKKDVTVGWRNGIVVEILEGLEPGERVVTVGKEGLKEGTKVRILGEDPEEPEEEPAEEPEGEMKKKDRGEADKSGDDTQS